VATPAGHPRTGRRTGAGCNPGGYNQGGGTLHLTRTHRHYWQRNLRITAVLLALWFVVTYVVSFYARELSFAFFGWPFSFWMGAQGALVVYVFIIWYYARVMLADGELAWSSPLWVNYRAPETAGE